MSDRLKVLVDKEMDLYLDGVYADSKTAQWSLEEFAKLIIQECMDQCFSEEDEQRIAKHFGFDIEDEE